MIRGFSFKKYVEILATMFFSTTVVLGCSKFETKTSEQNTTKAMGDSFFKQSEFFDSGADNSLTQDDNLFKFVQLDSGSWALHTSSNKTNIHSHIVNGNKFDSFVFSGKMLFTDADSGIGITFLSQYPEKDAYYRIRRYANKKNFHLDHHGQTVACEGTSMEGLDPLPNTWYQFRVDTRVLEDSTHFSISMGPSDGTSGSEVSISCQDNSAERFTSGTIGVWSMGPGEKYFADFRMSFDPFGAPTGGSNSNEDPVVEEPTPEPVEITTIPIHSVSASSNDGNLPENVVDGSLTTRWSAQGDGQYIDLNFNGEYKVERVEIAFYKGDQRTATFDIDLYDGQSLKQVYSLQKSISSSQLENYNIGSDLSATALRITGHGNSSNNWNSILEVKAYGYKVSGDLNPLPGTEPSEQPSEEPSEEPAPQPQEPQPPQPNDDFSTLPASNGAEITVNTLEKLNSAIANARGGERILLESGSYGNLSIKSKKFSSPITIRSKNGARGAKFGTIKIYNSSQIRFDSIEANGGREAILVEDASSWIEVTNSHLRGSSRFDRNNPNYEQVTSYYSIQIRGGSSNIAVLNSLHTDVRNGPTIMGGNSITLKNNFCDWVRADCYKMAGVDGLVFEGNFGAKNIYSSPTAHVDFFQAQGLVKNAVIRNNVFLMGTRSAQGLFFGSSDPHENILVENNIIHTGHIRAISFNSNSIKITVRNNTVINVPDLVHSSSAIMGATTSENNIISKSGTSGSGFQGSNLTMQHSSSSSPFHYSDVYTNIMGRNLQLEDLRPVTGGPGDCGSGLGAEKFICEKLGIK